MKIRIRARGKIKATIAGETYTFRMSQSGLTIRRKWARQASIVTFNDLLAHAQGQLVLPMVIK